MMLARRNTQMPEVEVPLAVPAKPAVPAAAGSVVSFLLLISPLLPPGC